MSEVAARKRDLRSAARRRAPPPPTDGRSAQRRLLALSELSGAGTVALYAALPSEPPTDELAAALASRGVALALPRVAGCGLVLHRVTGWHGLAAGERGVREPPADAPGVPPERVDLFVVPGLLFDRSGRRLGRGGGHYDRLLARARADAPRVGLCYAEQVVDELPEEEWDVRVHLVVTPREVIRPRAGAAGRGRS